MQQPTSEMITFFEKDTAVHISRVRKNLAAIAPLTAYRDELLERGEKHDLSKYSPKEFMPYVWRLERIRCRKEGIPFTYPDGVEPFVDAAVAHHFATNRHHVEFHIDPNDMTEIDLIEMICDWTAVAQVFNQNGGSCCGWADKVIGSKYAFAAEKRTFIYATIALLDKQLGQFCP